MHYDSANIIVSLREKLQENLISKSPKNLTLNDFIIDF